MTREKAIEIITLMCEISKDSVSTNTSNAEALEMAIEALKCGSCSDCLLYRSALIKFHEREESNET